MKEKKSEHSPAPQPERAIYGFFLLLTSLSVFLLYFVLSLAPDLLLEHFQVDFLPGKYWFLAIPAFLALLVIFVIPIYCSLNASRVNSFNSAFSIHDETSLTRETQMSNRFYTPDSIDPIYDLPIKNIFQFLFTENNID